MSRGAGLHRVSVASGRHIVAGVFCVMLLSTAPQASAMTFIVNSNADTTDGACTAAAGGCTLREAIESAVATAGRDTILFDARVFPRGNSTPAIDLASPLPMIADPAGTVLDGGDGNVRIENSEGLVFASAPGVPLEKVTVANVIVGGATGPGVFICGGVPPACDEDVSGALVRNVVATQSDDGIRIFGRVNKKTRVIDSAVYHCRQTGIFIAGLQSVTGALVQGSTVRDCSDNGIAIATFGENVGSTILDSIVTENSDLGVDIFGDNVSKTKLTNVVADENFGPGIRVEAFANTTGVAITNSVASRNDGAGIQAFGGGMAVGTTTGVTLKNLVADANTGDGISLGGNSAGAEITRANIGGNMGSGLALGDQDGQAVGAKVSRIISAGNDVAGVMLTGRTSVVQQVHASANGVEGIVLGAHGAGDNTIENNAAASNGGRGIAVRGGSSGNAIRENVALGNSLTDLVDRNPGCGNEWTGNVFLSGSEACVH